MFSSIIQDMHETFQTNFKGSTDTKSMPTCKKDSQQLVHGFDTYSNLHNEDIAAVVAGLGQRETVDAFEHWDTQSQQSDSIMRTKRADRNLRCKMGGCSRLARNTHAGLCIGHGGGSRCKFIGCAKSARDSASFCIIHGGGKRCIAKECAKSAVGRLGLCVAHGGGNRCRYLECRKVSQGRSGFCIGHGGGRRCIAEGCKKLVRGKCVACHLHVACSTFPMENDKDSQFPSSFDSLQLKENPTEGDLQKSRRSSCNSNSGECDNQVEWDPASSAASAEVEAIDLRPWSHDFDGNAQCCWYTKEQVNLPRTSSCNGSSDSFQQRFDEMIRLCNTMSSTPVDATMQGYQTGVDMKQANSSNIASTKLRDPDFSSFSVLESCTNSVSCSNKQDSFQIVERGGWIILFISAMKTVLCLSPLLFAQSDGQPPQPCESMIDCTQL